MLESYCEGIIHVTKFTLMSFPLYRLTSMCPISVSKKGFFTKRLKLAFFKSTNRNEEERGWSNMCTKTMNPNICLYTWKNKAANVFSLSYWQRSCSVRLPLSNVEGCLSKEWGDANCSELQRQAQVPPPLYNFLCRARMLEGGSSLLRNPDLEDAFSFCVFSHLLKFLLLIIIVELLLETE